MGPATQASWLEQFRKQVPRLSFADKTLPCQPVLRLNFDGDDRAFHAALYETLVNAAGLRSPVEEFDIKESEDVTIAEMASVPMALRFLEILVRLTRPRRVLEIGTFIGISAMTMARALPAGGHLTTLEVSPRFAALARDNFRRNGLERAITLVEGKALDALRTFDPARPFDLIFLDADKDHYSAYFPRLDALLAEGGLLIIDDVLFHGDVLNEAPKTSKGVGAKALLKLVQAQSHYRSVLLPLSTGMLLMVKETSLSKRPGG